MFNFLGIGNSSRNTNRDPSVIYDGMIDNLEMWKATREISPHNAEKYLNEFGSFVVEMICNCNEGMWLAMTQRYSMGKLLRSKEYKTAKAEVISCFKAISLIEGGKK